MIDGFARNPSILPGDRLELCVSTDAPVFRVDIYRCGAQPTHRAGSGWLEGRHVPHHLPFHDWSRDNVGLAGEQLPAWPVHRIPTGSDWRSGVYVAALVEGDGRRERTAPSAPPALDARHARALFVMRSAGPGATSPILYKLPLLTWHAYNQVSEEHYARATASGGWCLYSDFLDVPVEGPLHVSVRRPGGGTGGTPFDAFNADPFDCTPRQTFAHWDALAVAWLEGSGLRVDYCTDLDLHEGGDRLLAPYGLLLSFGHDEYWSVRMRNSLERFVDAGGNAAFFGGNTCWWRIAFDDAVAFRRSGQWSDEAVPGAPENALTGVSFRHGGERPVGMAPAPVGFRVQHADHWVFAGTALGDGDLFGDRTDEHLVGYECDGAHFDRARLRRGQQVRPTGEDGTPSDFAILGVGDVGDRGWGNGNRAATLGVHTPRGTVFTAATTDWPRLLAHRSNVVQRITENVLDRLGRGRTPR
jgi:N,N-dimethylformamidase beta subunit-like protein